MKENDHLYRDNFTVRDHFAGRVMQSTIAGVVNGFLKNYDGTGEMRLDLVLTEIEKAAPEIMKTAYRVADAALQERMR